MISPAHGSWPWSAACSNLEAVPDSPNLREPAVAGRFYTGDADRLSEEVNRYVTSVATPRRAHALVVPHAGYVYSGAVAGAGYACVEVPAQAVVLCPNHTGMGRQRSVWCRGSWRLPGGDVPIDEELARNICERAELSDDRMAHLREHAIEVQLPFLRARRPDVRVVPICLARLSLAECMSVAKGLALALSDTSDQPLIVASTDMSHYVAADEARRLDTLALERISALDPEGLYEVVLAQDISMCGYIPTAVALMAARELGARSATLVRYGNSGEVSGDFDRVVGYAAVVVD